MTAIIAGWRNLINPHGLRNHIKLRQSKFKRVMMKPESKPIAPHRKQAYTGRVQSETLFLY